MNGNQNCRSLLQSSIQRNATYSCSLLDCKIYNLLANMSYGLLISNGKISFMVLNSKEMLHIVVLFLFARFAGKHAILQIVSYDGFAGVLSSAYDRINFWVRD
jgi:hypothetical protein